MRILDLIVMLLILGVVGTLCLFLCFLAFHKSELWGAIEEKEEEDDRKR